MHTTISESEKQEFFILLKTRFTKNIHRHEGIQWDQVYEKLIYNPIKLLTLHRMETTGGEPDVIGYDDKTGEYIFCDCSPESPTGRRSLCYDRDALDSRKENKPKNDVISMSTEIWIELLTEDEYRKLQKLWVFDTKTSSWVKTPPDIRKLGGAIFADFRYNNIFIYHNGADSYYAARGFRGILRV